MNKRYLIFLRYVHSVVYFVQGETPTEAIWNYISEINRQVVLNPDGSITVDTDNYPHPLAYIEANEKIYHEWQIRELPEWAWKDSFSEIFCSESQDGPLSDIAECRERFQVDFPKTRAKAFVWYLKQGHLVTFYCKKPSGIVIIKRYLLNWDGSQLTVEEWVGDYEQIVQALDLTPPRLQGQQQGVKKYPTRLSNAVPVDAYGKGSRIVFLSADVAANFSDSDAVNAALRNFVATDEVIQTKGA